MLLGLVFIISMVALTGCGGSGKAGEKNPYEGKWVAVSAQMLGVKVIFAKDGTDAMDPALYLTEEENAVIGEWAAESVEELLGDGPQTSMEGVDNINDALRLDFKSDRNVTVIYKGEEIGTFPWSVALGYCSIESENPSLTVMINDDGTLKVDYSDDDDYSTHSTV